MEIVIILMLVIGIPALLTMRKAMKDETARKAGMSMLEKFLRK